MKNIEIKYRINSLEQIVQNLTSESNISFEWEKRQVDIYFNCENGRLKLRKTNDGKGELIFYNRSDRKNARESHYEIFRSAEPAELEKTLTLAYGQKVVVDKTRRLYFYKNVRIHLDKVVGLGEFMEFEAVVSQDFPEKRSGINLKEIQMILENNLVTVIPNSYSDLLLSKYEMSK